MPTPRWIIIDDTDGAITYDGAWTATNGTSYNDKGNFGKTYNNTLHGTSNTGSLSLTFKGSAGILMGTTDISNSSGVIDPAWECFVDQNSIGSTAPFAYTENNWALCEWANLTDSQHVVTLNVSSKGSPFWFDRIQYFPSSGVKLSDATILVDRTDPAIKTDSSWVPLGNIGTMTQTSGATAQFKFVGSRLTWVGTIPTELPQQATSATYSIDGQAPVRFALPGLAPNAPTQFNYIFFQTDYLTQGSHKLVVKHEGNTSSTPLVLGSLILENEGKSNPDKHQLLGAIIGGVLGGFVLIVATIVIVIYIRRRAQKQSSYKPVLVEEPFHYIRPFTLTRPSNQSLYDSYSPSSGGPTQTVSYPFTASSAVSSSQPSSGGSSSSPSANTLAPLSRAERKRAEIAAMANSSSSNASEISAGSRVVIHTDSGVRLPNITPEEVVEHPPLYTQG